MLEKLFRATEIGRATILVSVTSFLSYVAGLLRDRVIATNFGTSTATDAYNASFLIPDFLFNFLIAGGLLAAFLPVFSEYLVKDKKEAYKLANTIITGGLILVITFVLIAGIFMGKIIPVIFGGVKPEIQMDIIKMTRVMLPAAIFFTISNSLGNILMNYKHFVAYAFSPLFYNFGIILGILCLHNTFGIYSAAIGVVFGALLHALIRIFDVTTTEYHYRPAVSFHHPGAKKVIKLMIPRTISLIAWQANAYIFAFVGMNIIQGGLAAFNFAKNIESFAVSLFGIAFSTAIFPFLTLAANTNNFKLYTSHIQKTIQRILFFTIPSMVGIFILSTGIVKLILSGGVFNDRSIELTSLILFFFAIAIPFESIVHILSRGFYALQNTITPMIINLLAMGVVAFCTFYIAPVYGIKWFSIGYSLAMIFQVIFLLVFLSKYLLEFSFSKFLINLSKTLLASGIMAVTIILSRSMENYIPIKISYVLEIALGAGIFFLMAHLLKAEELSSIKKLIFSKLTKNTPREANID